MQLMSASYSTDNSFFHVARWLLDLTMQPLKSVNASKLREQYFMQLQILAFTIKSDYLAAIENDFMIYWFRQRSFRYKYFLTRRKAYLYLKVLCHGSPVHFV